MTQFKDVLGIQAWCKMESVMLNLIILAGSENGG